MQVRSKTIAVLFAFPQVIQRELLTSTLNALLKSYPLTTIKAQLRTVIPLSVLIPILSEAYKIRGDAKYNLQNYTEAIKDYDKAIYMKPTNFKAYYQRGKAKIEIGKVSEARIDFRTALKFAKSQNSQSIKDEIQDALSLIE